MELCPSPRFLPGGYSMSMNKTMRLSDAGVTLLEGFEGFSAHAYWDVDAWAIGFGSRNGVTQNMHVTRDEARAMLEKEVEEIYGAAVNALGLPLNQNQHDSLCSFVYNLGTGTMESRTGIGSALRAQDWQLAGDEMLKWDKVDGTPLPGLTRRRQAERALFLKPIPEPEPEPVAGPASWLTATELRRCRELDAIRAGRIQPAHDRREIVLVRVLTEQRKRIWRAAQPESKGGDGRGWHARERLRRYRSLLSRTR